MPFLTSIPELVMIEILKNFDFQEALALRKVCHDFRNFIDDHKPDVKFESISVTVQQCEILVTYTTCDMKYNVQYRPPQPPKYLQASYSPRSPNNILKTIDDKNFVDLFWKDFEFITSYQSSVVESLELNHDKVRNSDYKRILDQVTLILKSRKSLLKTKKLKLNVLDQHQLLSILSCFDSNVLEVIEIREPMCHNGPPQPMDLDDVVKLEQWKKSREILVKWQRFSFKLEHFKHLCSGILKVGELQVEQLEDLKEFFLNSSTVGYFSISYSKLEKQEQYFRSLGHFNRPLIIDSTGFWGFRMKNSSDILEIKQVRRNQIDFKRVPESEVPENSVIQD